VTVCITQTKKAAFTISHKGCFSMQVIFKKFLYRVCADVLYQLYTTEKAVPE
jgi:hypothetical protein